MKKFLVGSVLLIGLAAAAYLASIGCCHLLMRPRAGQGWVDRLALAPEQQAPVAEAKKQFMVQKEESCRILCAKRAQMIQLMKQEEPDRAALVQLTDEIGQEQTRLEKATLDYLLAVSRVLEPSQKKRLMAAVSEELRTACNETACGMGPGCAIRPGKETGNESGHSH